MQKPVRLLRSFVTRTRSFVADKGATAAIEFAVIAPMMITLYVGGVELSNAIGASRKTTLVARTVADLTAQGPMKEASGITAEALTDTAMTDILNAASIVAKPYDSGNLVVTVSSIKIDNAGVAKVQWSDATKNGTPLATNTTVTLDTALAVPNTYLILGEATYSYVPLFGEAVTGTLRLTDRIYMRPRNASPACVKRNKPGNAAAMTC